MSMNDEAARQGRLPTCNISALNDTTERGYQRCACGDRFPSEYHLRRHLEQTGCRGRGEYARLLRPPRASWQEKAAA